METDWRDILEKRLRGKVAVVCVGNIQKGDDALGPLLAKRLKPSEKIAVFNCETVPENFLGPIMNSKPDTIVVVDCADFGGKAGEVRIFEGDSIGHVGFSTHAMSPSMFMSILSAETGADCFLLGVQGKNCGFGAPVSDEVNRTVELIREFFELYG